MKIFALPADARLLLTKATPRKEHHGDDLVQAISLRLAWDTTNDNLALLHPNLKPLLFWKTPDNEAQADLEGLPEITPNLRVPQLALPIKFDAEFTGYTLNIEYGIDESSALELYVCALSKFTVDAREGGSVTIAWSLSSNKEITPEVVGIDMWRPYWRLARELLPQAAVVVDKFHILRMAGEAMDQVRIRLARVKQDEVRRHWMRSKVQLQKRPHNLTEKQRFNLGMWLDNEPEIAAAYRAKEAFYDIFDMPKDEAIQAFDGYAASVPASVKAEFKPLLTAMRNWRAEILAVFDHPFTNAYTESLNSLTKHIVKAGRGYSFEVLRARILASYAEEAKKPLRFEFLLKNAGNPCGNCGLPCRAEDMHPVTLPPMVRGQRAKRALVCALCEARFNTGTLKAHRKPSTQ